ncbi:unnamed protein product [Dicrocoelium dendriticum]|nr:unnamed protein product [Dicrocoelium dendriticum]
MTKVENPKRSTVLGQLDGCGQPYVPLSNPRLRRSSAVTHTDTSHAGVSHWYCRLPNWCAEIANQFSCVRYTYPPTRNVHSLKQALWRVYKLNAHHNPNEISPKRHYVPAKMLTTDCNCVCAMPTNASTCHPNFRGILRR